MVQVSSENNYINVSATSTNSSTKVTSSSKKSSNAVDASNDQSKYWASLAENYANAAEQSAENAENTILSAITSIKEQETNSLENIQNKTSDGITLLEQKYEELREGLSTTYIHEQAEASEIWYINHNLNKKPSIMVVDTADTVIEGVERYIDENNIEIQFNNAFKGKAYLN